MSGEDVVALKELINAKLAAIKEQQENANKKWMADIGDIKSALNYLSQNMVQKDRFESKMHQVKDLQAMVSQQDERIDNVEHFQSVLKYVGGLLVLIIMALITTYLTGLI